MILLGAAPLCVTEVVRAGAPGTTAAFAPAALDRIRAAEVVVARHAASEQPVYGLNTGLGGNLGTRIAKGEVAAFQVALIRGRAIAVGPALPQATCRAAMLCRLAEIAGGATGISLPAAELLLAMFNRGVVPVLPGLGSIGASDIGIMGHMAAAMIGRGEAWLNGQRMPAAQALAEAGLAPLVPGPKDGLALVSHGAATSAAAAMALHAIGARLRLHMAVLALAMEGYAANPAIHDPRLAALRPAPGQAEAAAALRRLLEGSALNTPGVSRNLQDALCFRLAAPVMGAAFAALRDAETLVETEINGATTSPAVLVDSGEILSSPNFHAPALTLALDALAAALAHAASASGLRIAKLMTARFSGLPAYLSPAGGGSAGYVPLQKVAADLCAEIRLQATPAGPEILAVSDTAEDLAPLTLHAVRKLERQITPLRYLAAIEALAAAQAVDLRGIAPLGAGTATLHAAIRARVAPLAEDRESAFDVEAVAQVLDTMAEGA